jgi:hypothetical protein
MKTGTIILRGAMSFVLLGAAGSMCQLSPARAADNQPPAVTLTAPTNGQVFQAPATIRVAAAASDPDGWVQKVEFFATILLGVRAQNPMEMGPQEPFEITWSAVPPGEYELTARATDNGGATTLSGPVHITVLAPPVPPPPVLVGGLRREVFTNIPGILLADLTNHAKFPDHPDLVDLVRSFETPSNIDENYGTRLRGFLLPPVTGDYVFYLASDDQGALFLSTDENPANKRLIAREATWRPARAWVAGPDPAVRDNISAPIRLEAGQWYYVEALHKEAGGGDNLAAAWQKPGDAVPANGDPPIPGEFLAPFAPAGAPIVTITAPDPDATEQSPLVDAIPDTARFAVHRTGDLKSDLTVHLAIGGTAINGVDYETIAPDVLIPTGAADAEILVRPIDDALVEGDETVVIRVGSPFIITDPGLPVPDIQYFAGAPSEAVAVIHDNDLSANLPPNVRIAEPREGWVFQNPPVMHIVVSTFDRDGGVTGVELFDGNAKLGEAHEMMVDAGPGFQGFSLIWTNPPLGEHVLTARATDDDGAIGVSAPVHITVQPPAADRELHVVGVYSGMSNGGPSRNNERGDAAVVVNRPGEYVTLCLSAYEPVLWHLAVSEGTMIERLILTGYYQQTVEGLPAGVPVLTLDPGGPQPWVWMGYAVESGEFCRGLCQLHAMTGMEIASFHGSYTAPYPLPFVIDAVQDDPRLRSDYPQPTPLDQLPNLAFSVDFFDGNHVLAQAYTLGGPANAGGLLLGNLRVTANADRTKFYGLADEGLLEADAAGGARVVRALDDVLREGWLMGATFDTLRQRALLVTLSGDGALYGYAPASGMWSTITSMNNVDLCSLAYHPGLDALFGLEVTRSCHPVLDRFNPDGRKVGQIALPFMPFDIGVVGHRAELVPVGNYLVMLVAPMGLPWDGSTPDERMYLIDPQSGQAWLTYRNACGCAGTVSIEATDPVASEPGDATVVDTAEFRVRRTGDLTQPLTVDFAIQGSAQNGVDYSKLSGEITIEAGRTSASILVNPLPDQLVEGVEDVVLTLMPPSSPVASRGPCARYFVGSPTVARATILDNALLPNPPPRAEIVNPRAGEMFQAPADIPIVVQATDPDGYVPLLEVFADGLKIGEQDLEFFVAPPPGQTWSFSLVWSNAPAGSHVLTVRATDNRGEATTSRPVSITVAEQNTPPWVSIFAPDPLARETPVNGQTNTASFKIRRTGSTDQALTVWYSIHGSADNGKDYQELPGAVTISAGRRSARVTIAPIDDHPLEYVETVVLQLEPAPTASPIDTYRVGSPDRAGAIIVDSDWPGLSVPPCLPDGSFHVRFPGQDGLSYRLEVSPNLADWTMVADAVASDGCVDYVDADRSNQPCRFYRLRPVTAQAFLLEDD